MKEFKSEFGRTILEKCSNREDIRRKFISYLKENGEEYRCPFGYQLSEDVTFENAPYSKGTVICTLKTANIFVFPDDLKCYIASLDLTLEDCSWLEIFPEKLRKKILSRT